MPRGLSTEIQTAIAAGTVRPVYLLFLNFAGYTLRTWTGEGDLSYDSQTWSGDGTLQSMPEIAETGALVAEPLTLRLTGAPDTTVDLSDPAVYQGRPCEVYIGFATGSQTLPAANIYLAFRGKISQVQFRSDVEREAWTVTAESRIVDLQRQKASRWSHEEQRSRHPGGAVLSSGSLTVGELYEVTDAGTGADFSASGGPASPTVGDRWIATGTSATWGDPPAVIKSLPDNGCAHAAQARVAVALFRDQDVPGPKSRKIVYGRRRLTPTIVFAGTSGSSNRYLNLVVAIADHECASIEQLYLDDRAVLSSGSVAGEFVGSVDMYTRLGTVNQAYVPELTTEVGSAVWDESYRLRGVCYLYLRLLSSDDLFGNTLPLVEVELKGKKLYDPRDTSTAYSRNAALVARDYLLAQSGFGATASEIDDDAAGTAADVCDELVAKADESSEPRYQINGVIDSSRSIGQNLRDLLRAMAGRVVYAGGEFVLLAGAYVGPAKTITDGDLVESIDLQNQNRRELSNGAKGIYANPARDWTEEDYPAYSAATAVSADGESRDLVLDLPLTTSPSAAQRLAKIAVNDSRRSRSFSLLCQVAMMDVLTGDTVALSLSRLDQSAAIYRVEAMRFEPIGLVLGVRLEVRKFAADFYAWDETTEEKELQTFTDPTDALENWVNAKLAAPSASPGSQSFSSNFNATISHNETGVTCHYTLDGSAPTESDATVADGGTILIEHNNDDVILKLKTFDDTSDLVSDVITYTYTAILTAPSATGVYTTNVPDPSDLSTAEAFLTWSAPATAFDGSSTTLETEWDSANSSWDVDWTYLQTIYQIPKSSLYGYTAYFWDDHMNEEWGARVKVDGMQTNYSKAPLQYFPPFLTRGIGGSFEGKVLYARWNTNVSSVRLRWRERANASSSSFGAWSNWIDDGAVGSTLWTSDPGYTASGILEDSDSIYQYEFQSQGPDAANSDSVFIEGQQT